MKKILLFVTAILLLAHSYATSIIPAPKLNANEIYLPVGANGTTISLLQLSTITTDRFETVSGRKMNFAEKISFKISQRKLRKSINPDGTIDNKRFEKLLAKRGGETGFHIGGFALGLFLGLIGVLIAYLIKDDYKANRVKWAWIGFAVLVVILLIGAVV